MNKITNLTDSAFQSMVLTGNQGQRIGFTLKYQPSQQLWYYNVAYLNFALNQSNLVVSPNILHQFYNNLPFGIACISNDGYDPYYQNDFITGRISLYLLNQTDRDAITELL